MNKVKLEIERCKGCGYCVAECPKKAISFTGDDVLFRRYFAVFSFRSRNKAYGVVPNSFLNMRIVCDIERPEH